LNPKFVGFLGFVGIVGIVGFIGLMNKHLAANHLPKTIDNTINAINSTNNIFILL